MSISTLIGTRILSGIGALALTGSIVGGTAMASAPAKDNPVRELHHELRDASKAERDEIKTLRKQLAEEYAKDSPDVAKMQQLHDAIEAKQDALRDMRCTALMQMHDELDAAQRARVAEHLAGHEGKGKHEARADGKGKDGKGKPDKGKPDKAERKDDGKGKDKAERKGGKDKKANAEARERGRSAERRPA